MFKHIDPGELPHKMAEEMKQMCYSVVQFAVSRRIRTEFIYGHLHQSWQ